MSSDDWAVYSKLMESTRMQAMDFGRDASVVAESICYSILDVLEDSGAAIVNTLPRLADVILSSLDESEALPSKVVELVNKVMVVSYPDRKSVV